MYCAHVLRGMPAPLLSLPPPLLKEGDRGGGFEVTVGTKGVEADKNTLKMTSG
jgi:hypothetical protein